MCIRDSGMSDIREYVMDDFAGERSIYTEESVTASGVGLLFAFLGSAFALMTAIIPPAYSTGEKIGYAVMSVVLAGVVVLILRRMRTIIEKRASRNKAGTAVKLFLDVVLYAFFGGIIMFFMSDLGENNRASTLYAFVLIALPFLICKMKSRSEWSAKLIGQLRGFRNFIADAEVPKLEELIEQDPKFFYHALPYAYVFGLTKKWASSFEKIDIGKPDWYEPYAVDEDYVFDALMMNSMFSNVSHDLGRNITVPSLNTDDSGGGDFGDFGDGFSGGGFSGGGFGGGGGGSW